MRRAVAVLFVLAIPGLAGADLSVRSVFHEPLHFDPAVGQVVTVRYHLDTQARTALALYDGRDRQVRRIESDGILPAGDHSFAWDGRDARGRPVPAEAYAYTLEATDAEGSQVVWDLTDATGGEAFQPDEVRWDPKSGAVEYVLPKPARVRIRMGLANGGPLLRTLIDWVPRASGEHREPWDGRDASAAVDLTDHPSLELVAEAFELPRNTVLVGPAPSRVVLIEDLPPPPVERQPTTRRAARMFDYAAQPIETRRDFAVRIELPNGIERNGDGLPVARGPLAVRVAIDEADLPRVLAERFETSFYLDGQFVWENEVGFLPMTWTWIPAGSRPGVHYLTANVRGYDGHVGAATVAIVVGTEAASPGVSK